VFYSNFILKTRLFEIFDFKNDVTLKHGLGSLKVIGTDTDRSAAFDFLLDLSRTVSQINGDFIRKSEIFPTSVYFAPPLFELLFSYLTFYYYYYYFIFFLGYCQCLRPYNPVHTVYMNVMFLHFSLFTCVTCVRINDDDDDGGSLGIGYRHWDQKTTVMWIPERERSMTISSAVWIQYIKVTDGQTDIGRQQRSHLRNTHSIAR